MELKCDGSFREDLKAYTENVLEKAGISSQSAEREIMVMAEQGNTVCRSLYGDMVFYQKILRSHWEREAFRLYLSASGITVADGKWEAGERSYPAAYWSVGYYLVHYRRESVLKNAEMIPEIEALSLEERLEMALELATACLTRIRIPGALNLMGRILREIGESCSLQEKLGPAVQRALTALRMEPAEISISADRFFEEAAGEGYVYACNNLAARAADEIVALGEEADPAELKTHVEKYLRWLGIAADRYEPYAANRLGLFYRTGEVRGTNGEVHLRMYTDHAKAKDYFRKATIYPNENSAWAYLNLMKYYHQDYDRNIDLMNEHMDLIRILSPAVYDIAMEL